MDKFVSPKAKDLSQPKIISKHLTVTCQMIAKCQ